LGNSGNVIIRRANARLHSTGLFRNCSKPLIRIDKGYGLRFPSWGLRFESRRPVQISLRKRIRVPSENPSATLQPQCVPIESHGWSVL